MGKNISKISSKIRNIFFCWSYHHILIATCKVFSEKKDADIVLINLKGALAKETPERITNEKIFKKVYYLNADDIPLISRKNIFKYTYWRYHGMKKFFDKKLNINFSLYDEVYTFYDFDDVGAYLQVKKVKFHLIEDAIGTFTVEKLSTINFQSLKKFINPRGIIRIAQLCKYCLPIYGNEKWCVDIEVDNDSDLNRTKYNYMKYVVKSEQDYFRGLNEIEKEKIIHMFAPGFHLETSSEAVLLLTEPLFADGKIESIDQQIKLYESIIRKYSNNMLVIIKAHPRDKANYTGLRCDMIVLDKTFPSEIISLIPGIRFKKYITWGSSAIKSFPKEDSIVLERLFPSLNAFIS